MKTEFFYKDNSGIDIFVVTRIDRNEGKKIYREYILENGKRATEAPKNFPTSYPPYNYHRWDPDPSTPIFFVEGEKCCDFLASHGFNATTTGGSSSWDLNFAEYFNGRKVHILPDNDSPGKEFAHKVALSLFAESESEVFLIQLEGLGHSEDVVDWFEKGKGAEDLIERALKAEAFKPMFFKKILSVSEMLNAPVTEPEWLVDELIPSQSKVLIHSHPKAGKTRLARYLATRVADGKSFLGKPVKQGPVLFFGFEDSLSFTTQAIREYPDFSQQNVHFYIGMNEDPANFEFNLALCLKKFRPALVIIDTMAKGIQIKDFNDYQEVIEKMAIFDRLLLKSKTAFCLIHHSNKTGVTGSLSINGSTGIAGSVDAIFTLTNDGETLCLQIESRFGPSLPKMPLEADNVGQFHLGEPRPSDIQERIKENLVACLGDGQWVPQKELLKLVKGNNDQKIQMLKQLGEEEIIESRKIEGGGKQFRLLQRDLVEHFLVSYP